MTSNDSSACNATVVDTNCTSHTRCGSEGGGGGEGDGSYDAWDDITWILTSTFLIFTMQSGFGLLESGMISVKNQANVMLKNVVDVVVGGLSYWMIGYGLSFGKSVGGVFGSSKFFLDNEDASIMGADFAHFFFQSSFAATATTIVSGALAERVNFLAYAIFAFFHPLIFAVPCHWIWSPDGFLTKELGAFDFAGSGVVHVLGGVTGLVGCIILKPRLQRFEKPNKYPMSCPSNVVLGLFFLWWGWIGFNCGSVFGIGGDKWILATKSAVTTMRGATGGGMVALFLTWFLQRKKFDVVWLANGVLGGLVGVTSFAMAVSPWGAMIVGGVGAVCAICTDLLLKKLKIDDPVGAVGVHAGAGVWSLIAVGFFAEKDTTQEELLKENGVFYGGDGSLLGAQLLYILCLVVWTALTTFLVMKDIFGADLAEHGIGGSFDLKTRELFLEQGDFVSYIPPGATEDEINEVYKTFLRAQGEKEMSNMIPNEALTQRYQKPRVVNVGGRSFVRRFKKYSAKKCEAIQMRVRGK